MPQTTQGSVTNPTPLVWQCCAVDTAPMRGAAVDRAPLAAALVDTAPLRGSAVQP